MGDLYGWAEYCDRVTVGGHELLVPPLEPSRTGTGMKRYWYGMSLDWWNMLPDEGGEGRWANLAEVNDEVVEIKNPVVQFFANELIRRKINSSARRYYAGRMQEQIKSGKKYTESQIRGFTKEQLRDDFEFITKDRELWVQMAGGYKKRSKRKSKKRTKKRISNGTKKRKSKRKSTRRKTKKRKSKRRKR